MKRIRVRTKNGLQFASALRAAGYQATWLGPGSADSSLFGGCTDPDCCDQHWGVLLAPQDWGVILTDASGTAAHRVWVTAGLLPPCGCKTCKRIQRRGVR